MGVPTPCHTSKQCRGPSGSLADAALTSQVIACGCDAQLQLSEQWHNRVSRHKPTRLNRTHKYHGQQPRPCSTPLSGTPLSRTRVCAGTAVLSSWTPLVAGTQRC